MHGSWKFALLLALVFGCSDGGDVDPPDPTDDTATGTSDTSDTSDTDDTDDTASDTSDSGEEALDCEEDLVPALDWFDTTPGSELPGTIEFGQTHVIEADEDRQAPGLGAERETILLFTPEAVIESGQDVRVGAFDGETLLGVLAMAPPEQLPEALEQSLTGQALDPYSTQAWSAHLPWSWVRNDITLHIGHQDGAQLAEQSFELGLLGAPHTTTLSRGKIVLFGEGDEDTTTLAGPKLLQDMFGSVPGAELRLVDYTPWRLDELVVNSASGPQLVTSEAERTAITSDPDRWNILKHQFALRHSLANTGRGLALTIGWEGDSSPYSYGTSFVMGWVVNDGDISDINNSPYAAGWTGWTAIWLSECDNTLIHELGHSFARSHFTSGTAASWGIADEYPEDGRNQESHPWGFDSTRRLFRTWYSVDVNGPVEEGDSYSGKYDPMNGGDAANEITCYPQFTAYHAQEIQAWQQNSPNLLSIDGVPGIYQWNASLGTYESTEPDAAFGQPIAIDVPVALVVGTLGVNEEANQTYPPQFAKMGNVFALADPEQDGLDSDYDDAQYFLEITYGDGSTERALIARASVEDTSLYLYSLTLALERDPTRVDLYFSESGYPGIDVAGATLLHSREIGEPADDIAEPVFAGRGQLANGELLLEQLCTEGVDCDARMDETTWRGADSVRHFADRAGEAGAAESCLTPDDVTLLNVPLVSSDGEAQSLVVYAQRVVSAGGQTVAVPLNDTTPWLGAPDLQQSLRVWAPYEANQDLPAGEYQVYGDMVIDGFKDGVLATETHLRVDMTIHQLVLADLADGYWTEPEVTCPDSSVYFLVEDGTMGPRERVWWDGPAIQLTPPVVDQSTGEVTTLVLDAYKVACDDWWPFNTGQSADWNCDNYAVLYPSETDNNHLESGHTYVSPGSSPLVIEARRWHDPDGQALLETFALQVTHTAP